METKIFLENFEIKKKAIGLIHKVYLAQLKSSRQYTASTKTKLSLLNAWLLIIISKRNICLYCFNFDE